MLTIQKFLGLNNVQPAERLRASTREKSTFLAEAMNVDIGLSGELMRRQGFAEASDVCHKNLWDAGSFHLSTIAGGDLVSIDANGDETVLYPSLGVSPRVWYWNWPDGRVAFSNGLINGLVDADGAGVSGWGVPVPADVGALTRVAGDLYAGSYRWGITYQRLSDGVEGGLAYSAATDLIADSGVQLDGLPELAGYRINVYLSSHNGQVARLAGSTTSDTFTFTGANDELLRECQTEYLDPAPIGTLSAHWRGSSLVAFDNVLFASRHAMPEHFRLDEDFKPFKSPITLLQPVQSGIFVGTTTELAFLRGETFKSLAYERLATSGCVLGSGVTVPGEHLGKSMGDCFMGICGGFIVAGYQDGSCAKVSDNVYKTDATEVAATFRVREDGGDRIPQYIAIAQ